MKDLENKTDAEIFEHEASKYMVEFKMKLMEKNQPQMLSAILRAMQTARKAEKQK
jgi:hypothetical protein